MTLKNRLIFVAVALTLWVGSGLLGLRGDGKWRGVVDRLNALGTVSVPIDGMASLLSLQGALEEKGIGQVKTADLRPAFLYQEAKLDGKALMVLVISSKEEKREGAFLTMDFMEFLHAALDDPKAEGVMIDAEVLSKAQVSRLLADLKGRGRPDLLPRWAKP